MRNNPANISLLKISKRNTRKRYKICSKLTIKTPEHQNESMTLFWCFYCYFWTYFTPFSSVSIVDYEQVNVSWESIPGIFFLLIRMITLKKKIILMLMLVGLYFKKRYFPISCWWKLKKCAHIVRINVW